MPDKLSEITSAAQFADFVGTWFRVTWGADETAELELISATASRKAGVSGAAREPFSLVFRAKSRQFYLPQAMYLFQHERHGALDLFIVPIGPDEIGMRFEAVFN